MTIDKNEAKEGNELELASELDNQNDKLVFSRLKSIVQLLSHEETSQPDITIDKSIIAAAHRDATRPCIGKSYQIGWWRKVSLPLYVSAGFVFTVVAYKNLWPEPIELIHGEDNSAVAQDIYLNINNSEHTSTANAQTMEKSTRLLPELTKAATEPNKTTDEQFKPRIEPIQPNINLLDDAVDKTQPQVFTGNQLVKAKYREQESWARKIIEQMRSGQFEQARNELQDFKEIYPNYPIEEQIKVFIQ